MKVNHIYSFIFYLNIFCINNYKLFGSVETQKQISQNYWNSISRNKELFLLNNHNQYTFISSIGREMERSKEMASGNGIRFQGIKTKIPSIELYGLLIGNIIIHIILSLCSYYFYNTYEIQMKYILEILMFINPVVGAIFMFLVKYFLSINYKNKSIYFYFSQEKIIYSMFNALMLYYGAFLLINWLFLIKYEDISLIFFQLHLSEINQLIENIKKNSFFLKIYFLIMFCIFPIILFQLSYFFLFESNIYYEYNDKVEQFSFNDFQLISYIKIITYLKKNKKTIFDLADDDPEALRLLNS